MHFQNYDERLYYGMSKYINIFNTFHTKADSLKTGNFSSNSETDATELLENLP